MRYLIYTTLLITFIISCSKSDFTPIENNNTNDNDSIYLNLDSLGITVDSLGNYIDSLGNTVVIDSLGNIIIIDSITITIPSGIGYYFNDDNDIFKTTDSGISWSLQYDFEESDEIEEIDFINETTGYLTDSRNIFKTTDSGISWFKVYSHLEEDDEINGIDFVNETTGYLIDDRKLFKTTDSGVSWFLQFSLESQTLK